MPRIRCSYLAAGLLLMGLSGCGGPSPTALYQALAERYAAATALHSEATLTVTEVPAPPGAKPTEVRIVTDLGRPNRLRWETRAANHLPDSLVVSDGRVLRQKVAAENAQVVLEAPAPAALTDLLGEDGPILAGALNGLPVATELALFAGQPPAAGDGHVTIGDAPVQVGGVACHKLTYAPLAGPTHVLQVGIADGLLRGLEVTLEGQQGSRAVVSWQASRVVLDQPAEAGRFTLAPGPGETVVKGATMAEAVERWQFRVGQPAPEFTLPRLNGGTVSLRQLRGKVVVLDFWATWCGPCKRQQPALQELHATAGDGVRVFMISSETAAEIRPAVQQRQLTIPQLLDAGGRVAARFHVEGYPTTIVIDRQGIIRQAHSGVNPAVDTLALYRSWVQPLLAGSATRAGG